MVSDKTLLIVYHSQSGNTELLSGALEEGALKIAGSDVRRIRAALATGEDIRTCRVLVICSPEYFGYMAGAVKDLFDRTYEQAREHTAGKSYAAVICAGNDGSGALNAIVRIAAGYKLRKVQEPIIVRGAVTESALEECRTLGETLAAGIELGIY